MKRGDTERQTLELNGWTVGDILEGDEGFGPDRILITAVGEQRFLCKWDYGCTGEYGQMESGNTTLRMREWRKVGNSTLYDAQDAQEEGPVWKHLVLIGLYAGAISFMVYGL